MVARGHQIVARALRRGGGEDRRLELGEALVDHPPPDRRDDARAQQDVLVDALAPQVQEAVAQPHLLARVGVLVDRHGKLLRLALDGQFAELHLHPAGGQLVVDGLRRALHHHARHGDDGFDPQPLGRLEDRVGRVHHALGEAVMVAQIDEQQLPMVALAVNPARQADRLPGVVLTKLAAGVRAIGVHGGRLPWRIDGISRVFAGRHSAPAGSGCQGRRKRRPGTRARVFHRRSIVRRRAGAARRRAPDVVADGGFGPQAGRRFGTFGTFETFFRVRFHVFTPPCRDRRPRGDCGGTHGTFQELRRWAPLVGRMGLAGERRWMTRMDADAGFAGSRMEGMSGMGWRRDLRYPIPVRTWVG